jgi:excinuclease UvrABC nuclease subunit
MKLTVSWDKPIRLKDVKGGNSIYSVALEKIPNVAGIYIFARRYGKSYEALYVGKSTKLRARIKGHLNNLKLMG